MGIHARAGSQTNWHFGDDEAQLGRYAWYGEGLSGKTYTVGGKQANPFGLHDMHGNVWEWVEDCYRGNYRGAPKNGSAWQENCRKEKSRVLRGGSWYFDAIDARAAGATAASLPAVTTILVCGWPGPTLAGCYLFLCPFT